MAEARLVKDDEMKGLERTLVEVLVEQQKKLLELLSEVGFTLGMQREYASICTINSIFYRGPDRIQRSQYYMRINRSSKLFETAKEVTT